MAQSFIKTQGSFIKRSIKNAWHNSMRNKLLSIATILIIALMLFVFNLILALSFASESVIDNVTTKLDLNVEIQKGVESYSIQSFIETLKTNPQIKEVFFVGKAEALDQFGGKYPGIVSFLDNYNYSNPLPDAIRITTYEVADNNAVIQFLEEPQFASIVNQDKLVSNLEQKERNEKIFNITQSIKRVSFWIILTFALVGIMIIFNSININIHTHEKEIQIMKLVGAKYGFIRSGYILEGIFFAVAALILSVSFSQIIVSYLISNLGDVISSETLLAALDGMTLYFSENFWSTLLWLTLATVGAGFLSSYLAIELYLRKKHAF